MSTSQSPVDAPRTPWARLFVVGVVLAAVVSTIVIAFLWPTITATVKDLPIALAGESAQVSQLESALDERSPGTFDFTTVDDRDAAVELIETREVYGAIVLGTEPEVLTASAGSPVVAQLLGTLAPALQAQLNAALAAQGIELPAPLEVAVTDVVPLASTDARGTALAASSFPLVLGGMLGGIAISVGIVGVWRRVTALVAYAVVGGLALAGIMQGWFGALQGNYLVNASAISLALLAIGGVIVGFVSIFGRPGIAIGPIVFLLIANPIASAAQPLEFLAQPWGLVGQWFPPGAAATLLRDLSYFPRADALFPWLVLAAWAAGGLLLALVGHFRDTGAATSAALAEVEAEAANDGRIPRRAASLES
ncbi:MAG: hypothetical protein JWP85_223 [Rhodoglobus sp.]|nr:hypothetical protein [Rhodoglobus sp.]